MVRARRDLKRQRPRIRNAIRSAVRLQPGEAARKTIGRGFPKEWLEGIFRELLDGEPVVWDYDEPSGEIWVKKVEH